MQTYPLVLLLLLAACTAEAPPPGESTAVSATDLDILTVRVATVGEAAATDSSIRTTGVLVSKNLAKPSFKIGGVVAAVNVAEGDRVRKGQRLASLNPTEIDAGRAQAQLAVEKAERDLRRITNLYQDSVATRRQLDDSRTALDVAKQQLESVDFNRSYTVARAPISGTVLQKLVNPGEITGPGQPVCIIQGTARADWRVRVALTDAEWSRVQEGDAVEVTFDAYPDTPLDATIAELATTADPTGGTFAAEMRLRLPNAVRPAAGLVARVVIPTDNMDAATGTTVSLTALAEADSREAVVFVAGDDDRVERRIVQLGALTGTRARILAGLRAGERVVTDGAGWLRDGDRVRIVE